jgi:iron complex outermembrane recepter protein
MVRSPRWFLRCKSVAVWMACSVGAAAQTSPATVQRLKSLTLEQLMEVEVTSVSRAPERLAEAGAAIQVVTHDDIRRFGPETLPDALRLANNLNVARKNAHDWGISARGFNTELANKLLVLLDGRTLYTPLFSGVRWDVQDYLLGDVNRIEVVSGPGGTLWGANAVNGVINVITKSAADTQGFYIKAGGGSQLRQINGLRYGGALSPNTKYRVYGKFIDHDTEALADGSPAGDSWHRTQGGFRIDSEDQSRGTHLTLQGDLYRGESGLVGGGESATHGGNLLGRWSAALANNSSLSLQVYFDRARFQQPVPRSPFGAAGTFGDELDTYDLDFQHRLNVLRRHKLVWGFGYRRTEDHSQSAPSLGFDPATVRQRLVSGFVQDEISLSKRVALTVGTKVENNSYTGTEFDPTVRAHWQITPGSIAWAAISRAVRTPSRIDRDLRQPAGTGAILRGGRTFASESVVAYEAGYRREFGAKVFGSISGFYNQYDNIRSARPTPVTTFPVVFANDVEGSTHGFETTLAYRPLPWWRLTAGFNLLRENLRVKAGANELNNALNETADPEHQASLRSSMDFGRGFALDANVRWVDALLVNNVGRVARVPSYTEADVRFAWQATDRWELSVVGRNLLHRRHPEFGLPSPTRVELKRAVYARAVWQF